MHLSDDERTEEADKVSSRIAEILSETAFSFSPNEYVSIHRKLFQGIYKHAGKIRDYNITKKEWVLDGATVMYGSASELRATLEYDFSQEKDFSYKGLSMDEIIHHLAVFISRLWQIHIFGEGNTRTTAVFFIKYLRTLGFSATNDIFAENAWYFRNALVRANYPELVSEWSEKNLPLTPDDITFGSNKKVWWKGTCGHEWQTSVKARSNGEKCPICSGARVIAGINDLATLEPLLVKQWSEKNKIKPTEVSIGSHKKVIWRCEKGHEWEAAVKSRTINKTGCPYCSHNKVLAGFNDLATLLPDIAAEWSDRNYPTLPTQVTVFANRKAWWKCMVLCQEKVQIKCNQFSLFLKKFNLLFLLHSFPCF